MPRQTKNPNRIDVSILDGLREGVQIIDFDWYYVYVNEAAAKHGKSTKEELVGNRIIDVFPAIEKTEMFSLLERVMFSRSSEKFENEFTYPDGSKNWFELRVEPISQGIFIISINITERKHAELNLLKLRGKMKKNVEKKTKELSSLTSENQALLKELHHRVKNNLQIVSSLLNIQMYKEEDSEVYDKLKISRDRISTIALIHESLYRRDALSGISVQSYLNDLVTRHVDSYRDVTGEIEYEISCDGMHFEINTMVPLGLMINELVTNSLKHAFPDKNDGKITIVLESSGDEFLLTYMDDGVGLIDGFVQGTGQMLLEGFVDQIDGQKTVMSSPEGLMYTVRFKVKDEFS